MTGLFKKIIFLTLLLLSAFILCGQNPDTETESSPVFKKNAIHLTQDFLVTLSINYEYRILLNKKSQLALRAGFGNNAAEKSYGAIAGLTLLYGKKKHFLEGGLAYQYPFYYRDSGPDPSIFAFLIGYRYESKKGFIFRVYPELIIESYETEDSWGPSPFLGFSIGYAF